MLLGKGGLRAAGAPLARPSINTGSIDLPQRGPDRISPAGVAGDEGRPWKPQTPAAGIHPFVVGLIALIACNGFFLPYQSTTYLAMYHGSGENVFTHAQARPAAIAYGVVAFVVLCASVVAWRAMGLL